MWNTKLYFALICVIGFMLPGCEPEDDPDNCKNCAVVYKPNVYIYPESTISLDVSLAFPMGGSVIASIPEYQTGWHITVDPSGIIDKTYTYLFYESEQPDIWQTSAGWTVKSADLEMFFKQNMARYGFKNNEIQDFITYWIPRLTEHDSYAIYPQTSHLINDVIELNFSKQPDNVLRLFYVIKGNQSASGTPLTAPHIEDFRRNGFVVTEWGVVL